MPECLACLQQPFVSGRCRYVGHAGAHIYDSHRVTFGRLLHSYRKVSLTVRFVLGDLQRLEMSLAIAAIEL
ncbi:hypothetical protein D3C72_2384660 [compost metagenome]